MSFVNALRKNSYKTFGGIVAFLIARVFVYGYTKTLADILSYNLFFIMCMIIITIIIASFISMTLN